MIRAMLFVCLCVASTGVLAEKAYQWTAEDGSVMFSTTPPDGVEYKEIELRQPDTIIEQDKAQLQRLQNKSKFIEQRSQSRQQQREALQQQINEAEKALKKARQALADGETPLAGEAQRLASGSTRLTPAYFARQEQLKKAVTEQEQRLKSLRQEMLQLR